jgi:hypothetical protein
MNDSDKIGKFWGVKMASQPVAVQRMKTCRACTDFIALTSMCKNCGCYMPFKTKLKEVACPKNHWSAEDPS